MCIICVICWYVDRLICWYVDRLICGYVGDQWGVVESEISGHSIWSGKLTRLEGWLLGVSTLDCQGMARDGRDCLVLIPWTGSTRVNWVRATRACGTRAILASILRNWGCKGFRAVGFEWMDELRKIEYMGYKLKSITLSSQKVLLYGTVQGRAMLGCD